MFGLEIWEIIGLVFGLIGVLGVGLSIYQWGILNEGKKHKGQIQYLIASLNSTAIQKQMMWQNQISLLQLKNSDSDLEKLKIMVQARDGFADLSQQALSLEGVISDESAITDLLDKAKTMAEKSRSIGEVLKSDSVVPKDEH